MMKKILIYGGTSLISLELIKIYLKYNYEFIIFTRNKDNFKSRVRKFGLDEKKFELFEVDLSNLEENLKLISGIKKNIQGILWIAGETGNALSEFQDLNLAKKNIEVNFLHPALIICKLISKLNTDQENFIAVVTSVAGLRGRKKNFFYGSAKSAMISFLSGLRQKFSGQINILTIIPGYMSTEKFDLNASKFLVTSPERSARIIYNAINNKKEIVFINFIWRVIMFFISLIPEKIFKKLNF